MDAQFANPPDSPDLHAAYRLLRAHQGHQGWWPAETAFEVCVGAILVQNTAWTNVVRAIGRLRSAGRLAPEALLATPTAELEELIRPSGTYRIKARRLRLWLEDLHRRSLGDVVAYFKGDPETLRTRLLGLPGIGPETADAMLLYAGGHATFIASAYARRIFSRHGWWPGERPRSGGDYEELRRLGQRCLKVAEPVSGAELLGDFHAQIVAVAKRHCVAAAPRCEGCPLSPLLPAGGPVLRAPAAWAKTGRAPDRRARR